MSTSSNGTKKEPMIPVTLEQMAAGLKKLSKQELETLELLVDPEAAKTIRDSMRESYHTKNSTTKSKSDYEKLLKENMELRLAIKAIMAGELALRHKKTRTFKDFLKAEFPGYAEDR